MNPKISPHWRVCNEDLEDVVVSPDPNGGHPMIGIGNADDDRDDDLLIDARSVPALIEALQLAHAALTPETP